MARRPDPSPFGSRQPERPDLPLWMLRDVGNLETPESRRLRARLEPDFFRMLRELRAARIRVLVEAVTVCTGVGLFFVLPFLAMGVVVAAITALTFDLVVLARLRRRVAEAWEDLAVESA